MKRKYFLRGLGAGIVLSAVVMGVTTSKADLSDEEIRKRAIELGMVEKPDALEYVLQEKKEPEVTSGSSVEKNDDLETTAPTDFSTEFPTITPVVTQKAIAFQNNIKPIITKTPVVSTVPKTTKEPKVSSKPESNKVKEMISVTITVGMYSQEIAEKFKELGLVENAKAFDDFLCDNGYASLIREGSYKIAKGSSYEEIAKIITK